MFQFLLQFRYIFTITLFLEQRAGKRRREIYILVLERRTDGQRANVHPSVRVQDAAGGGGGTAAPLGLSPSDD